jgi:hypothetical protein
MHGNVKELVQDNPALEDVDHRYKKLVYEYDLISGNVNKVSYQPGMPDQFFHRYEYDADNRIVSVFTSKEGLIWDNDAKYQYYKHGPLARTELGDLKVQGIDYAYTLQGWIKAVNGFNDMGQDGNGNDFAKDAMAYSLHYNKEDYSPINSSAAFLDKVKNNEFANAGADLYNGNISKMATAIHNMPMLGKTYKYDELNRLIESNTFEGDDLQATEKYKTTYQYDANGNIKKLTRQGNNEEMDDLTYHYAKDGNGNILSNRLLHVNDAVHNNTYGMDLKDQGAYAQNDPSLQNYTYDEIGNLIKDEQEEIAEIVWTVTGKVQEIRRTPNSTKESLKFGYDGFGNRISKTVIYPTSVDGVKELTSYYVRDMQGNVMAVYEKRSYDTGDEEFRLTEQHIYGSSRLGMRKTNLTLYKTDEEINIDLAYSSRTLGEKQYELTSHTGNVLAVVSDKKISDNEADVVSTTDYYPFGMQIPSRAWNIDGYRYSFGSHEKDSEVNSGWYSFGDYGYDARLGRRPGPDPKSRKAPSWTPYRAFFNNPLYWSDATGNIEYQIHIIISEKTGEAVVEVKTANSIMTDGKKHAIKDNSACRHEENNYYDYATITVTTIPADGGEPVVETQTKILYENGVKNTDYVWFGGDEYGDTQRETWLTSPDEGVEVAFGIAITGGGDGPIAQDYTKNIIGNIDFGDLEAIFKRSSFMTQPAGSGSWKRMTKANVKEWIEFVKENLEGGEKMGDAINSVSGNEETRKETRPKSGRSYWGYNTPAHYDTLIITDTKDENGNITKSDTIVK